ncbi:MAG: ABC transporter permease [Halomonas sp.]|uniref:ABC transporter permease n=1 Tax=Halomonas sp. TaxID=1486246 RepID=UPI0028703D6C|nr:ABC transporter permease [Halomonas sp.]MDR9440918.1 ABC transporter permease [Halomonas sp.]
MNLSLLYHLTRQDLVDSYAGSILGAAWTFIMPLVNILIFTLIFSRIMGMRLGEMGAELEQYSYSVYLVIGVLAWNLFANTLSRVTHVFHEKAAIIGKVNVSLFALPLYILFSELTVYVIASTFFIIFLLAIDFDFTWHWLWWPLILIVQQTLAYAIGIIFATLSVFIRDIKQFVGVLTQLWFWLTPIVYVINILPEKWKALFLLNPFFHIVNALRDSLMLHSHPALIPLVVLMAIALLLLAFGLWLGQRLERDIRDFI